LFMCLKYGKYGASMLPRELRYEIAKQLVIELKQ